MHATAYTADENAAFNWPVPIFVFGKSHLYPIKVLFGHGRQAS
jgi:hypothetical protein